MISSLVYRHNKLVDTNPPVESLFTLRDEPGVMLWVDLAAATPDETKLILEQLFALHPLVIEDCTVDNPVPKLEAFDDYLFIVMHAVDYSKTDKFSTTELDLVLGRDFLLTFHAQPLRPVQAAMERSIRSPQQPVRGPDRFAHTILDLMVDAYQPALHELREELEDVEEAALQNTPPEKLFPDVLSLRKDLAQLRQIVRPQRAVVAELTQGKARFVRKVIVPYLRDLGEDLQRIESQAAGWADQLILSFRVYLNKSNHEAGEGIRVLTSLTALTLPPLIIGGWFGMNFDHMELLGHDWAYPAAAALTLVCMGGMLLFMRKRHWI